MIGFDFILAAALIALAWRLLSCRDLFRAVVLFISFGLLMAVAWARLNAPDIALAEAAIGSAVTGALLLAALGEFKFTVEKHTRLATLIAALFFGIIVIAVLVRAAPELTIETNGLRGAAVSELESTGVSNAVTAVLLSYRGYDTLLEMAVLLMASLAVLSLENRPPEFSLSPSKSPVLGAAVHSLVPLLILMAGYLLWVGSHAPGGAFQAGAVLAGAAILATLADPGWKNHIQPLAWRFALAAGLLVFISVAAGSIFAGEKSLLEYRGGASKTVILIIESAATVSIATTLLVLFVGRTGRHRKTDGL